MKEQTNTAPIIEDTNPTMYSLPSIKNLLLCFSSFYELVSSGLLIRPLSKISGQLLRYLNKILLLTRVNISITKLIAMPESWIHCCLDGSSGSSSSFALVNTSSKCQGTVWPALAKTCAQVSCYRLKPNTALKEIYPVSQPTWHLWGFPVALFCKVQIVVSYLLW